MESHTNIFNMMPTEILYFFLENYLDTNDIKTLLITSKIFGIFDDKKINEIKKKWNDKYCKIFKYESCGNPYKFHRFTHFFNKKQGQFIKKFETKHLCIIKQKTIKGFYKNNKLDKEFIMEYENLNLGCKSCGFTHENIHKKINMIIKFDNGKLISINYELENVSVDNLVILLELEEEYKIQLCHMLNIKYNKKNIDFLS